MVREAEQNGNAFAAIWHLDRLIAARPDDWFLYARRARAWSLSDQFDKAAADYQQAERLGSREQVLDFQAHYVLDCTRAGRWAEALWYLDRLIAARPDDGSLHEDRAAVYGKLGREADRQAELARVFELGADAGTRHPPGRGAWPRRPLGRGRGPAGTLRPDRSAQPGAGPGLGHRLPEGGRPRRLPRGLRGGPDLPGTGPDGRLERARARRRCWPWAPRAWTITACRSPGSRSGWPPFPRRPPVYRHYFLERIGRAPAPGRPDRRGDHPPQRRNRRREGNRNYPTDWAYLALAHAQRETSPKPAGGSNASALRIRIRRHPSGISRSSPSSGARPSPCSSMPSFRVIRFKVRGRDEPAATGPLDRRYLLNIRLNERIDQRNAINDHGAPVSSV